ncbi:MAG: T9SS C-terminal target domain-containing protein [Bacteroidetes bacterium]|nr:MAG: T9SS C-terminal target domain-containing protein [Bacteroidota bacterium]MBL1144703.1 T9SS C-terminal target domain-containing protein [Bacteroidota bacterium]MCB0803160.1 T9SS type A sorting domain-containing protein [Flavobacteriales bacterium]NOG57497.1 T9SS type A sorting domain-containing protein [Bacteroidota bacterium]
MKKIILSIFSLLTVGFASAQSYQYVDINQINYSSPAALQNCVDTSVYIGDTIITRGYVVVDGNLSEVVSSSVTGNSRPFITLVDTANGGAPGPFKGIVVMGVNASGTPNTPNADLENALAGDLVELTCIVADYAGLIQLQPLDNNSFNVLSFANAPTYQTVPVGDLQNANRENILPTGEQWDGSYVEIQNVTVTSVSVFSGGSRTEFTVADANGNQILVADRFLPMKVNGIATVNPNSPKATGTFVAPSVGTVYNYIRGVIFQDQNGCAGGGQFNGGYEINPFDSTHFDKAASPASISLVNRMPKVPNASQTVTISADIVDNDGVVTGANLYYSADQNAAANTFSSVAMTSVGSVYSAVIPAFPVDSLVRYYIEATDDSANVSIYPGVNNFDFYTVRANGMTIMDIQKTLSGSSADSPYAGDTVTVTGIVTSSYQSGDMGYLYMQDANGTAHAGILVDGGGTAVFSLMRGQEITVTGIAAEQYGFTKITALTVTATGNTGTVNPVVIDPSDVNLFGTSNSPNLEKYESMLLRYENPMSGGKVYINNPNLNFGEYSVGSGVGATVSARVLAGRQSGTSAQSSLDVSVVSDSAFYAANMNVPAIQAKITQNMDALVGILYYSFNNFKLTPRNNADFVGFSEPLVSIEPLVNSKVETSIFPNPAQDRVNVSIDNNYKFNQISIQVIDVTGRVVVDQRTSLHLSSLNLSGLEKGMYLIRVSENNELIQVSKLILK